MGVKLGVSHEWRNRVRKIFGPKWEEVTGDWRKLHNEELHDLYCSTGIFTVIRLRRVGWAGHVARIEEIN